MMPSNGEPIPHTHQIAGGPSIIKSHEKLAGGGRVELAASLKVLPSSTSMVVQRFPDHAFDFLQRPLISMETISVSG
jgi:hypothetical protein